MVLIPTQTGVVDFLELDGPRPGVVWLRPWSLFRRPRTTTGDQLVEGSLVVSNMTIALGLQDREARAAAPPPTDESSSVVAANLPSGESDIDPEVESAFAREIAERRLTNVSRALIDQDLTVERGVSLPHTFTPPNDEGFILVATDGGEDQRDARGRRTKRSSVRIAMEAWLRIAQTNRVRLFPWPVRATDPLWVDGAIQRHWMSATCVPFFYDMVSRPTAERPRALRLAIPSQDPGRALAIEFLQRVYANEARSRAQCRVSEPKFMTPAEAVIVLRMWKSIAGTAGTRAKRIREFRLSENASDEQIAHEIIRASHATSDELATGVFTREQYSAARSIMNNVGISVSFRALHDAYTKAFNENDPVATDQLPQSEEALNTRKERVESAYQRLLLARFLARNPPEIPSRIRNDPRANTGPKLAATPEEERNVGLAQALKIMNYDPATNTLSIRKDSRWRLGLKKATLNLVEDEDGNFDSDASNISHNIRAWIDFLWGDQFRASPESFSIELEGLGALAQKLFYGRI